MILFATGASFGQPAPQNSASGKRPFTFEDMMALKRLSEPVPSPDGKWVVCAAEDVDLKENTPPPKIMENRRSIGSINGAQK